MGHLEYKGDYIQVFRFRNGRISEFREYIDTASMSRIYGFEAAGASNE
jgi:ketosteroid isomerase-like protein